MANYSQVLRQDGKMNTFCVPFFREFTAYKNCYDPWYHLATHNSTFKFKGDWSYREQEGVLIESVIVDGQTVLTDVTGSFGLPLVSGYHTIEMPFRIQHQNRGPSTSSAKIWLKENALATYDVYVPEYGEVYFSLRISIEADVYKTWKEDKYGREKEVKYQFQKGHLNYWVHQSTLSEIQAECSYWKKEGCYQQPRTFTAQEQARESLNEYRENLLNAVGYSSDESGTIIEDNGGETGILGGAYAYANTAKQSLLLKELKTPTDYLPRAEVYLIKDQKNKDNLKHYCNYLSYGHWGFTSKLGYVDYMLSFNAGSGYTLSYRALSGEYQGFLINFLPDGSTSVYKVNNDVNSGQFFYIEGKKVYQGIVNDSGKVKVQKCLLTASYDMGLNYADVFAERYGFPDGVLYSRNRSQFKNDYEYSNDHYYMVGERLAIKAHINGAFHLGCVSGTTPHGNGVIKKEDGTYYFGQNFGKTRGITLVKEGDTATVGNFGEGVKKGAFYTATKDKLIITRYEDGKKLFPAIVIRHTPFSVSLCHSESEISYPRSYIDHGLYGYSTRMQNATSDKVRQLGLNREEILSTAESQRYATKPQRAMPPVKTTYTSSVTPTRKVTSTYTDIPTKKPTSTFTDIPTKKPTTTSSYTKKTTTATTTTAKTTTTSTTATSTSTTTLQGKMVKDVTYTPVDYTNGKWEMHPQAKKDLENFNYKFSYTNIYVTGLYVPHKHVVIPPVVNTIDNNAFSTQKCLEVESIFIPDSVHYILTGAFSGCKNLKKVELHAKITNIPKKAFANTAITSIVLPDTVKTVRKEAFLNCNNLKRIYVPKGCKVEVGAIPDGCVVLDKSEYKDEEVVTTPTIATATTATATKKTTATPITTTATKKSIDSKDYSNSISDYQISREWSWQIVAVKHPHEVMETPKGISFIGEDCFNKGDLSKIRKIIVSDNVRYISYGAFYGVPNLEELVLTEQYVTRELPEKFLGPCKVEHLVLPLSVNRIPVGSISDCTSLKSVSVNEYCRIPDGAIPDGCVVLYRSENKGD